MSLFENFGKRVSEVARNVGQKTAEATEVARLSSRISAKESEIEQLFVQIGKAYYSMRGASGTYEAADLFCQKVKALEDECGALRDEIDSLRNQSRCPNCGGVQPLEASFCASCGTKLPKPVPPEPTVEAEPEPEEQPAPPEPEEEAPRSFAAGGAQIIWPAPQQEQKAAQPDSSGAPDGPAQADDAQDGEAAPPEAEDAPAPEA
jgi:uncharacterized small protein (DUF1192 family)